MVSGNFPKVQLSETQSDGASAQQVSKYDAVGVKAGMIYKVTAAQGINPDVKFNFSFHPRSYLGYQSSDPCNIAFGIPFNRTTAASGNCGIYAGHWLYRAGTRLTQGVDSQGTTLRVSNASRLRVGEYAVIYDAPAGGFRNAEHVRITGVNTSVTPHRVTLAGRGYKSTPRPHGSNSIIAMHERGQAGSPQNWAWNITSVGPRDSNNRTIAQVFADWIPANFNRNVRGQVMPVNVTGVYFDEDEYILFAQEVDANNDLVIDNAILANGRNVWGEGLDNFYQLLRNRIPGKDIVGGWRQTRGFGALNGTQMENWLLSGDDFAVTPEYLGRFGIYSQLHNYMIHLNYHQTSTGYTEVLSKVPTRTYPGTVKSGPNPVVPPNNRNFRLGFGAALLGDGYYGRQNSNLHPDPWYDEYAVDVTPGSSDYGRAVRSNPQDESAVRANKGWLGRPLGPRRRIYNANTFRADRNLISNGGFESGTAGWGLFNINAGTDTNRKLAGTRSLRVSGHVSYAANIGGASLRGPSIQMVAGRRYTLAFAARAETMREVSVQLDWGRFQGIYLVPNRWTRLVYTMTAERSGTFRPIISLGREQTPIWFDEVYVFEGDPNVFRRDFENGIVVVNATPASTSVDLGGEFLRIRGTGQDSINNGARISSVSLPPFDAAILVRPQDSQPAPPPPPPQPTDPPLPPQPTDPPLPPEPTDPPPPEPTDPPPSGSGNVAIGGEAWRDQNKDGIQDAEDGPFADVLLRLLTCGGTQVRVASTGSDGSYLFAGLPAGNYKVQATPPTGWFFSPALRGSRGDLDSNIANWPGETPCMNLGDGDRRLAVDVGLVRGPGQDNPPPASTARIGDRVWSDTNGNGIQNAGEPGLPGATVRLLNCSGEVLESTVSGNNGQYSFTVDPGNYQLRFIRPDNTRFSPALRGSSRAADSNINPATGVSGCMGLSAGDDRQWFDVGVVPN